MNLQKALTYMFEDKQWLNKAGLGALISIVPILNIAWVGYSIEIMRRVMKGDPLPMPEWDELDKKFMDGLMLFLAGLVYVLPVILLVGVPFAILIVPSILTANSNTQDLATALFAAGGLVYMGLICIFFLYGLALSIVYPAIYIEYARKGTFASCFNFKEIFAQIRKNAGAFFTAWGVYLGISIGASLASVIIGATLGLIPCLGQLFVAVVILAVTVYVQLVYAHLFGQYGAMDGMVTPPIVRPPMVA